MDKVQVPKQSQLNVGTLGHVDHGKTTLTYAITHQWTDIHSESVKRSMTIKLGYSDVVIGLCGQGKTEDYTTAPKCPNGSDPIPVRRISILDAPGHETLMATAIAGSNIIDAALFVISATEPCPMPQTKEHLMLINALGLKTAIIAQTKIDIAGKEQAMKNYAQIKSFIKGSSIESAKIIPVMPNRNINVDVLLEELAKLELPKRDTESDPIMYIARSFDVNRPGSKIHDLQGGIIGGSIMRGKFKVGDEIEIRPGVNVSKGSKQARETYKPIITKIESLESGINSLDDAIAGGLIAIGTDLDPSITKADGLVGQIVGHVGKLPETSYQVVLKYESLNRDDIPKQGFKPEEPLLLGIGTSTNVGYVKTSKKNALTVELRHAACVDKTAKISVLRNFNQRWRLSGYGTIL
jgi:translation initiation factor 2 subunit 3